MLNGREVVDEGVLTGEGYVDTDPSLNEDVAVGMKAIQGCFDLVQRVRIDGIASYKVAEVEKRRDGFDHFGWDMPRDCCNIHLNHESQSWPRYIIVI